MHTNPDITAESSVYAAPLLPDPRAAARDLVTEAVLPLRLVPGFQSYASARMLSWGGSAVSRIALPVTMYGLTASPLWTASVVAAEAVPYFLLGLLAGAVADRSRHLALMVGADLLSGAILLTIPGAYLLNALGPLQTLIAAALVQGLFVFFDAANFGLVPSLVGRARILSVNSLLFACGSAIEAVVPALAGALLVLMAAPVLVTFDALSFLASAVLLGRTSATMEKTLKSRHASGSILGSILEGLRYITLSNRVVGASTCISALLTMANGGLMALLVVWAGESFDIANGDPRLGFLYADVAIAGVIGGVVAPWIARRLGALPAICVLVPLAAVASYAILSVKPWWAAALLMVAAGTFNTAGVITIVSLRQQIVPRVLQSRVNTTARMIAFGAGYAIGAALAGSLAGRMGAAGALRIVFLALIATTLVCAAMPRSSVQGPIADAS